MFGLFNNAVEMAELRKRVSALTDVNELLSRKNADLTNTMKSIETQVSAADCEFVIDFTAIRCFSIERQSYGHTGKTVLGYNLLTDSENRDAREWVLYCNEKQHQKLIDNFNRTKENNGTI